MNLNYLIMAIISGFCLPLQGALGARLGVSLASPMYASLVSYAGGLITCILFVLFFRMPTPTLKAIVSVDWYLFLPGFLGAIFVSSMMFLIPKIGVANVLMGALVGQMLMSAALDHFGAFGNPEIHISPVRFIGILMLVAGLVCIQYGGPIRQQPPHANSAKVNSIQNDNRLSFLPERKDDL